MTAWYNLKDRVWTKPRCDRLKALVLENTASYSEIGAMLGVSKNAAIGQARRMGLNKPPVYGGKGRLALQGYEAPSAVLPKPKTIRPVHKKHAPRAILRSPGGGITLAEAQDHHCRWMLGSGLYCGQKVVRRQFCTSHAQLAYQDS